VADTAARRLVREDPVQRQVEQIANTVARRVVRDDSDRRVVEQVADNTARRLVRQEALTRQVEQVADTTARRLVRQDALTRQANVAPGRNSLRRVWSLQSRSPPSLPGIRVSRAHVPSVFWRMRASTRPNAYAEWSVAKP
jgi:hypothetical protein